MKDEGSAEECMKSMEQMMNMLKMGIEQAENEQQNSSDGANNNKASAKNNTESTQPAA